MICQLKKLDRLNRLRNRNAAFLSKNIDNPYVETPAAGKKSGHVWHQYTIKVKKERDRLAGYLKKNGIDSAVIYPVPIHKQPLYRRLGLSSVTLKHVESIVKQVLSIPVRPGLTRRDLSKIARTINEWKPKNG